MKKYTLAALVAASLAGCAPFPYSETPVATNFETTRQEKLQAAQHWQVVAEHLATQLVADLSKGTSCVPAAAPCAVVKVEQPPVMSAFARAFHAQLISSLVNKGVVVSADSRAGDVVVSIDAQTVRFSPDRQQYLGVGRFTLLTTGVWALDDIYQHHSVGAAVLAGSIAADVVEWNLSQFAKGPTPRIELILTASATSGGKYLARKTSAYYIADSDAALYCWKPEGCSNGAPAPTLRVVGDCGAGFCTTSAASK